MHFKGCLLFEWLCDIFSKYYDAFYVIVKKFESGAQFLGGSLDVWGEILRLVTWGEEWGLK